MLAGDWLRASGVGGVSLVAGGFAVCAAVFSIVASWASRQPLFIIRNASLDQSGMEKHLALVSSGG